MHAEIDILALHRGALIAVEVKARMDHPAPERLVDTARLDRLARALRALQHVFASEATALRIDAVAVRWQPDRAAEVVHFPGLRALAPGGRGRASRSPARLGSRPITGWLRRALRLCKGALRAALRRCVPRTRE